MHDSFAEDPIVIVEEVFDLDLFAGLTVVPSANRNVAPGVYRARLARDTDEEEVRVSLEWVHFHPTGFELVVRVLDVDKSRLPCGSRIYLGPLLA
jgi:hypothetical protein